MASKGIVPVAGPAPLRFGNYVLEQRLGQGGMAEVWKARVAGVQGFEKVVCIKRVLRHLSLSSSHVDMFVSEAKLSARLSHPNIVQVFDLGEVGGEFYMAMEFVRGQDLLRVLTTCIDSGGFLPPAAAAYVVRDVCRALAYAHEFVDDDGRAMPIIHRDVSPHNVMIGDDGLIKLVDFGVAKAMVEGGDNTRTGIVKGKLAYLAPEQLQNVRASARTDIFAAGIVLHELLTSERLFVSDNDFNTLLRLKTMVIPPPVSINPQVPAELSRIAMRALDRAPERRYASAASMADELDRYCAHAGFSQSSMRSLITSLKSRAAAPRPKTPAAPADRFDASLFDGDVGGPAANNRTGSFDGPPPSLPAASRENAKTLDAGPASRDFGEVPTRTDGKKAAAPPTLQLGAVDVIDEQAAPPQELIATLVPGQLQLRQALGIPEAPASEANTAKEFRPPRSIAPAAAPAAQPATKVSPPAATAPAGAAKARAMAPTLVPGQMKSGPAPRPSHSAPTMAPIAPTAARSAAISAERAAAERAAAERAAWPTTPPAAYPLAPAASSSRKAIVIVMIALLVLVAIVVTSAFLISWSDSSAPAPVVPAAAPAVAPVPPLVPVVPEPDSVPAPPEAEKAAEAPPQQPRPRQPTKAPRSPVKPPSAEEELTADPQSAAPATPSVPVPEEPETPAKPDSASLLASAQDHYLRGSLREAQEEALAAIDAGAGTGAWLIVGAASCGLKDAPMALRAARFLSPKARASLTETCAKAGIEIPPP